MGRPTKFKPELVEKILRCLEKGMPLILTCNACGIVYQTLVNFRQRHPKFAADMASAIAKGVERRLEKIEAASEAGDWRASAWLLEHCQPEHFAKNRVELTGADGSPLAGAIQIFLPRKDNTVPAVEVHPPKQLIQNGT